MMELTGIHQLLSGLAEMRREQLRRGQEALVVRLNFVFFTDSVSELYGQGMYIKICGSLEQQAFQRCNISK
jgi:hypothetical protein